MFFRSKDFLVEGDLAKADLPTTTDLQSPLSTNRKINILYFQL